MQSTQPDPNVETYLAQLKHWQAEMMRLRGIALSFGLSETLKWGKPCYMAGQGNTLILYAFKETCAVGFFKGALLSDPEGLLTVPGEHSQAMRMMKFSGMEEINARETALRALIGRAIDAENAGWEDQFVESAAPVLPEEFLTRMEADDALQAAFEGLTPGRQRAYALYFSSAKQSKTRAERVERCLPRILSGKGLND